MIASIWPEKKRGSKMLKIFRVKMQAYGLRLYSSKNLTFQKPAGPIPLGNAADQAAFEASIRQKLTQQEHESFENEEAAATGSKVPSHVAMKPLPAFPNDTHPETGEQGGPRGLEPTRYGDWERKGRVIDF
jgi:hypothetical protein